MDLCGTQALKWTGNTNDLIIFFHDKNCLHEHFLINGPYSMNRTRGALEIKRIILTKEPECLKQQQRSSECFFPVFFMRPSAGDHRLLSALSNWDVTLKRHRSILEMKSAAAAASLMTSWQTEGFPRAGVRHEVNCDSLCSFGGAASIQSIHGQRHFVPLFFVPSTPSTHIPVLLSNDSALTGEEVLPSRLLSDTCRGVLTPAHTHRIPWFIEVKPHVRGSLFTT